MIAFVPKSPVQFFARGIFLVGALAAWLPTSADGRQRTAEADKIDTGFLFVDGRYVAPPYAVRDNKGRLQVNEVDLGTTPPDAAAEADGNDKRRSVQTASHLSNRMRQELRSGATVVWFANSRPQWLRAGGAGCRLLTILCDDEARRRAIGSFPDWLPRDIDSQEWLRWFADFHPTSEFVTRAKAGIVRVEAVEASNRTEIAAVGRLETCAYPLAALAMLLTVIAMGHLLSHRPGDQGEGSGSTSEAHRAACRSLLLVCLLSALDLAWTLLTSQAGSMKELNPLGARLLENPVQLVTFKFVVTAASVGLLYALRRTSIARQASWWACLICTLLAMRWLVFSSLFVS